MSEKYYSLTQLKSIMRTEGNQWTGPYKIIQPHDIEKLKPADVRPVVRGEWRICDDYTSISKTRHRKTHVITWMCSECFAKNGKRKTNFCHNCGADMTGGTDE